MTPCTLSVKTRPQHTDWPEIMSVWQEADRLEVYRGAWLFDHFQPIFDDRPGPVLEAWSLLAALAARTQRLRLGVMVSGVTYRHPGVLAATAATVDRICNGRLDLGIGAAWNEDEHLRLGVAFPPTRERLNRLDEACAVVDSLLRGNSAAVTGNHYSLPEGGGMGVRPVQRPRPPFVIGGRGERRTLRTVARWADHWNLAAGDPATLTRKLDVLRDHCAAIGRDPATIEISVQVPGDDDPAKLAERAAALVEAGADHLVVWFAAPFELGRLTAVPDAFVAAGLRPRRSTGGAADGPADGTAVAEGPR